MPRRRRQRRVFSPERADFGTTLGSPLLTIRIPPPRPHELFWEVVDSPQTRVGDVRVALPRVWYDRVCRRQQRRRPRRVQWERRQQWRRQSRGDSRVYRQVPRLWDRGRTPHPQPVVRDTLSRRSRRRGAPRRLFACTTRGSASAVCRLRILLHKAYGSPVDRAVGPLERSRTR